MDTKGITRTVSVAILVVVIAVSAIIGGMYWLSRPTQTEELPPIKIGVITTLTGGFAYAGETQRAGIQYVADLWNEQGGVNGRKIEIVTGDDTGDPAVAMLRARQLVEQGCVALAGGVLANIMNAVFEYTRKANIPYLVGNAACPTFNRGSTITKYLLNYEVSADHLNQVLIKYLFSIGAPKKVISIGPDYAWGQLHQLSIKEATKDYGGEFALGVLAPYPCPDLTPYIDAIMQIPTPWTIVVNQFADEALVVLTQLQQRGVKDKGCIVALQALDDSVFIQGTIGEDIAEGIYNVVHWTYTLDDPKTHQIALDYYNKFGMFPACHTWPTMDQMNRVFKSMNTTKTTDINVWITEFMKPQSVMYSETVQCQYREDYMRLGGNCIILKGKAPSEKINRFPEISGWATKLDYFKLVYTPTIAELDSIITLEEAQSGIAYGDSRVGPD